MNSVLVTSNELYAILRQRYPNAFIPSFADGDYNIPTEESFKKFREALSRHLFNIYGNKWETYFDCDNYAAEAKVIADRWHYIARKAGKGNGQGVAFGNLRFLRTPGDARSAHETNFRLLGNKQVSEFEPQTCTDSILSPEQCATAFLVDI